MLPSLVLPYGTRKRIKAKHGDPRFAYLELREQGVVACVVNDMDRAAGRSGVTVMGSKI